MQVRRTQWNPMNSKCGKIVSKLWKKCILFIFYIILFTWAHLTTTLFVAAPAVILFTLCLRTWWSFLPDTRPPCSIFVDMCVYHQDVSTPSVSSSQLHRPEKAPSDAWMAQYETGWKKKWTVYIEGEPWNGDCIDSRLHGYPILWPEAGIYSFKKKEEINNK